MAKVAGIFALLSLSVLGNAALVDDGFDLGFSDIVLPGATPYQPETVALGQNLLGYRGVSAAEYTGSNGDVFTVSGGGGKLSAVATRSAAGLMELTYHEFPTGSSNLLGAGSVTLYVDSNSSDLTASLGIYSNGYQLSGTTFLIPAGFTGAKTVFFTDLTGAPLKLDKVDSLFLDFNVKHGSSIVLDRLTVNAVPEPATMAAVGVGLFGLLKRRKRA